ncbi:hypothetical protein ACFWPV_15620 [Streptomyces uncialis]|uniref:hypothetical protein n=1 Tax=Streptomyces uncialis TaxID=1048205 RepID=UPI00365D3EF5
MSPVVRSGPLTQEQEPWWLRLYWRDQGVFDVAWSKLWDMPPGISVEAARGALTTLVERHEVLRTAVALGPDNLPMQLVLDAGSLELPLAVVDVSTLAEFRRAGTHPLVGGSIFMRPLWAARLFTEGGQVRMLSFIFEHVICDGSGLRNLREQFLDLCIGRKTSRLNITHPLDRQVREAVKTRPSGLGRRGSDPTTRVPQILAPALSSDPSGDRFLLSSHRYTGLLPLMDTVCRRHRVSRTSVVMLALGWLLSRYTGHSRFLFASATSGRLPGDDSIDCVMRWMEVLLDLDTDASFADALTALQAEMLRTYTEEMRYGPHSALDRTLLAEERGIRPVRPLYFNYQGPSQPGTPTGSAAADGPADERAVELARTDEWRPEEQEWLNIVWVNADETGVAVEFDVDTKMFPPSVVHTMGEVLPEFVRMAAKRPGAALEEARALLPEDFGMDTDCHLVRGNWVSLRTVEEVLTGFPGARQGHAAIDGDEIVAHLTLEPGYTLFDVHEHVLTQLYDRIDLVVPHRYRTLGDAGTERRCDGGSGHSVSTAGVRDAMAQSEWTPELGIPDVLPSTEQDRELCAALRETHGLEVTNMAQSYSRAGGLIIRGPAVVESLRRRGFTGVRREHLFTPFTLRAIARSLTRR